MNRPRRWAAAAGVVLALTSAGVGAAAAANRSIARADQSVTSGQATLVLQAGQTPATGPVAPWSIGAGLLLPVYGNVTNTGTIQPVSGMVVAQGLNLGTIDGCTVPWNTTGGGTCSGTQLNVPANTAIPAAQLPAVGKTWYLRLNSLLVLGSTFYATAVKPPASSGQTTSS